MGDMAPDCPLNLIRIRFSLGTKCHILNKSYLIPRLVSGQETDQTLRTEYSVPLLIPTPTPPLDTSLTLLPSAQGVGRWHQWKGGLPALGCVALSPMSFLWPLLPAGAGSAEGTGARPERHLCGLVCARRGGSTADTPGDPGTLPWGPAARVLLTLQGGWLPAPRPWGKPELLELPACHQNSSTPCASPCQALLLHPWPPWGPHWAPQGDCSLSSS